MVKVVLSYRRNDTKWITGRIFEHLENHFGHGNVFMDIDNIPLGLDFRDHIQTILLQCDILIAVVGPRWLAEDESGQSSVDEETDWVRLEIATAIERKIPVVPLLVDGTKMPKPNLLPADLRSFAYRQAASLDTEDFRNQIRRLTRALDRLIAEAGKADTNEQSVERALFEIERQALEPPPMHMDATTRSLRPVLTWAFALWAVIATFLYFTFGSDVMAATGVIPLALGFFWFISRLPRKSV